MGAGALRPYETDRVDLREMIGTMLRRAEIAGRRALIVKLYTGDYDREVERVSLTEVFAAMARTLVQ